MLNLYGDNTNSSGLTLEGDSLLFFNSPTAASAGPITFAPGSNDVLAFEPGDAPSNQIIDNFAAGDAIRFLGFGSNTTATLGASNVLTVTDGSNNAQLILNPGSDLSLFQFGVSAFFGGVQLTDVVPVAITDLVGQPVNGGTVEFKGTANPGIKVSLYANDGATLLGTVTADATGRFDITTTALAEGIDEVEAVQALTFQTLASADFTLDVLPDAPTITSITPVAGPGLSNFIEIKGTGSPGETINLSSDGHNESLAFGTVNASGHFDIFSTSRDGIYTITATQTDAAGLTSAPSAGVSIAVYPVAPYIAALVGQPVDGGSIELTEFGGSVGPVTLFVDGSAVATGAADGLDNFDITAAGPFADGIYQFTATSTDASGLTGPSRDRSRSTCCRSLPRSHQSQPPPATRKRSR